MALEAVLDEKRYEIKIQDNSEIYIAPQEIRTKVKDLDVEIAKLKETAQFREIDFTVLISYTAKSPQEFEKIREFLLTIPTDDGMPKKDATFFAYD
ncbi:MAG: hypothetical protein V3V78_00135 [Candidatus Woesearchaeota archaeon]